MLQEIVLTGKNFSTHLPKKVDIGIASNFMRRFIASFCKKIEKDRWHPISIYTDGNCIKYTFDKDSTVYLLDLFWEDQLAKAQKQH